MPEPTPRETPTRLELATAFLLLAAALVLRFFYAAHFRIDSDEPQHLHVVWAWTRGLLPYRDVFDNHMPLFQALCAPLFAALGVRADIIVPMRIAMIPIFAGESWCVWRIAASLFGARTALWTAVLAALCPPFFFTSVEFRPDQLWTLLWLATLAVLVCGRISRARVFAAGILLGATFCVSMKTTLMLISLVLAGAGAALACGRETRRELPRCAAIFFAGMLIVPALVVLAFVAMGAGPEMRYCVLQHNIVPSSKPGFHVPVRGIQKWLGALAVLAACTAAIWRGEKSGQNRWRGVLIFAAPFVFLATLNCLWPILTAEDYLPFYPLAAVAVVTQLLRLAARIRLPALVLAGAAAFACIANIVATASPFDNQAADKIGMVADTLKLTGENDFVMDSKGETIYRRRPWRYVLEGLTHRRIRNGFIDDDIAQRLVETRTPLATMRRMPLAAHAFIRANYLPVAFRLVVLGKILSAADTRAHAEIGFDVAVPARYTFLCNGEPFAGSVDGEPFTAPLELAAGHHTLRQTAGGGALALIWATAIERGYSPFTPLKPDHTTPQD